MTTTCAIDLSPVPHLNSLVIFVILWPCTGYGAIMVQFEAVSSGIICMFIIQEITVRVLFGALCFALILTSHSPICSPAF